jgi:outer membrane protein OmpA-like peptidoglycan-associated protein
MVKTKANAAGVAAVAMLATALMFGGCTADGRMTHAGRGALIGTGVGATSGAMIGAASGDAGEGALIGGAVGAIAGAIIGDSVDARQQRAQRDRALAEQMRRQDLDARYTDRGVVVNFPDVLFEFGRADLTPNARRKIQTIAGVLNGPEVAWRDISIEGHTDSIGSEESNQALSQRRATAVANALGGLRVDGRRMTVRGLGEAYPIAANVYGDGSDNPAGRAKNRRVEVIILNETSQQEPGPQPIEGPDYQPGYDQPQYQQQPGYDPYPQQEPYYPPSGGGYPPAPAYPSYPPGPPPPPPYGY